MPAILCRGSDMFKVVAAPSMPAGWYTPFHSVLPKCLPFPQIQHQYTLTDESGPAHKKVFYVKLKLGQEEYAASGPSIKKAQHAAADQALHNTMYKHPLPKPVRRQNGGT